MTVPDPNLKKLLQEIVFQENVPEDLIVLQCNHCGDKIFIPNTGNPSVQQYWLNLKLDKACRWCQQRKCSGTYERINITLGEIKSWLQT